MRKVFLAAAAFAAIVGAAGLAAAQGGPHRNAFGFDANNDSVLTRQEFDAGRAAEFTRLDADRNGQVTREEIRAGRPERGDRGGRPERGGHRGMHLDRADANNDGRITREEFLSRPAEMFARLDANNDGVIAADERPEPRQRAERGQRGDRPNADANGDRQFSSTEWNTMSASMFQRLDANSDGRVTQEEAQAAHPRRGHHGGERN